MTAYPFIATDGPRFPRYPGEDTARSPRRNPWGALFTGPNWGKWPPTPDPVSYNATYSDQK